MTDERKKKDILWECLCDCGNTVLASAPRLKNGWAYSCGCYRKIGNPEDLSGRKIGRLTTLRLAKEKVHHENAWECRCDCGSEITVRASSLKAGTTRSCGCLVRDVSVPILRETFERSHVEGTLLHLLCQKKRKNNTSGTVGVCYDSSRGKWAAYIHLQNKRHSLGRFEDKADAIAARKAAEEKLHVAFLERHEKALEQG